MADEKSDPKEAAILEEVLRICRQSDAYAGCLYLEQHADTETAGSYYVNLVKRVYGEKQDVPLMMVLGHAGIHYCLAEARRLETSSPKSAEKLKGSAKSIAYNLGANSWPGWNDPGVRITASDLAAGLDAAKLNLRLGQELQRGPEVMGNAHWLLGAQFLAAGSSEAAGAEFAEASRQFVKCGKGDSALMAQGYAALALKSDSALRADGERRLESVLQSLAKEASPDAKFFAEQIQTAEKVLLAPKP